DCPGGDTDPESEIADSIGQQRGIECLQNCLRRLPPAQHELMIAYYEGEKGARIDIRQQLAQARGISVTSLRNKANWLRARLRMCMRQCIRKRLGRPVPLKGQSTACEGGEPGVK